VNSVDIPNRQCAVTTITGKSEIDIPNVQLMAGTNDGFMLIPSVDSMVYVVYSRRNLPFVIMFSQIDSVFLICDNVVVNDGSYGGMVQIINLTSKLNNLVAQLQSQLTAIATGVAEGGGSYAPGTISQFNKSDYENTEFKHGT
jgi:hypothetical protein